ncbi:MAG TPA: alpha/beta hydrolase-fold protein [Acidobacteriaceae bacterium]
MYEAEQLTLEPPDLKTPILHASLAGAPEEISFDEPVLVGGSERLRLHRQFASELLAARRDVIVSLPPDYFTGSRRYPALYLQDGQNLFDGSTSFIKGSFWDVQTTADRLIGEGAIEPLIVVGIYNTGVERMAEYTPMRDRNLGGGKGSLYGRLLIEELKPWVDGEYRTLEGPEHTGVGGSSLGGLESLYIGLTWPQVFGRLAVLSPSVWWAQGAMLQYVRRTRPEPRPRIWLDIGLSEGPAMIKRCDELHRLLERRGWRDGKEMRYTRVSGGRHNEDAWAKRVDPFLRFLFPAK